MDITHRPHLKEWFVVFSNGIQPKWWQKRFLKPGFYHVHALAFDVRGDRWVLFDPGWSTITIRALSDEEAALAIKEAIQTGITVRAEITEKTCHRSRFLVTCTSEVAHLLGVSLFVHTPFRLFKALMHSGAEISFRT